MSKGRKAEAGTYEAREFAVTDKIDKMLKTSGMSADGQARTKKAILFGLGVKSAEEYAAQKREKIARIKAELAEMEATIPTEKKQK